MLDNSAEFSYHLKGKDGYISHIHSPGFVESSSLKDDTIRLATGLSEENRVVDLSFPVEYVTDLL